MERYHIYKLGLAIVFYAVYCIRPTIAQDKEITSGTTTPIANDFIFYQGVQGKPGVDFPVLSYIPRTTFNCREVESGYYADLETDCQVFHICEEGRKISFLCPNGTIFQQSELICEWWFKVNCTNSPSLYDESAEHLREDNARRKSSRRVVLQNHGAVMRTEEKASVSASQNGRNVGFVQEKPQRRMYNDDLHPAPSSGFYDKPQGFYNQFQNPYEADIDLRSSTNDVNTDRNEVRYSTSEKTVPRKTVRKQVTRKRVENTKTTSTASTIVGDSQKQTIEVVTGSPNNPNGDFVQFNSAPVLNRPSAKKSTNRKSPNYGEKVNIRTLTLSASLGVGDSKSRTSTTTNRPVPPNHRPTYGGTTVLPKPFATSTEESTDSDEAQIPQETGSFYKNSFNRIEQDRKLANHRESYVELKDPQYYSTKIMSAISSVTPHYITTQPLNNGRPFLGSQVGTTLKPNLFNVGRTDSTLVPTTRQESSTVTNALPNQLFNVGSNDTLQPIFLLTTPAITSKLGLTPPPPGSFNTGVPTQQPSTFDHATVYGTYGTTREFIGKPQRVIDYATIYGRSGTTTLKPEVDRPRPFQAQVNSTSTTQNQLEEVKTTNPPYKISSAAPFQITTPIPTKPTPFETIDSMVNALANMANTPRPGLVIPPSAGPQTLHTLAVYFANALNGLNSSDNTNDEDIGSTREVDNENKQKLTELLTKMTMDRYNELFSDDQRQNTPESTVGTTTEDSDLETQHTKNAVQPPKVRQLAKVFTKALSSYLDDPDNFKKVLEEVRPTEPPGQEDDEEILNFSDADSKSSYPPIFPPTQPSFIHPTWGYLLAFNTSKVQQSGPQNTNSLENLQLADSQSFVSQYLRTTPKPEEVLTNHWTTSPKVTELFKTAFSLNPQHINENFKTNTESSLPVFEPRGNFEQNTEVTSAKTVQRSTTQSTVFQRNSEVSQQQKNNVHEIQYELRALPKLTLNSTQVHGILIDFMNKTEDNKLQRILKKLNTTQDEFLSKMREIESNPLTRRLILLLINECGEKKDGQTPERTVVPLQNFLVPPKVSSSNSLKEIVDESLTDDSQDTRALQLLNSLYTIASKFGK